ncbi:cytosolic protein [Deinococcus yunweiensis]|uniref:cytosolic protein n=1 Tax=Deinococcus yunweiensis TaxID=367282 RepID=UPI00398EB301
MTTTPTTTALSTAERASLLIRRLGVIELFPVQGAAPAPSAQSLMADLLGSGALPSTELIDAVNSVGDDVRRSAQIGVTALLEGRGDAPSLPQLRHFARTQVMDTGEAFHARLAAFLGLAAQDAAHCTLREHANLLPSTWGTAELGMAQPDTSHACATGILGTVAQGACAICHLRVGDPEALLALAAEDRTRRADRPLPRRAVGLAPQGQQLTAALRAALLSLTVSATPLSDAEHTDLAALVTLVLDGGVAAEDLMTDIIARGLPQREVRALVVGTMLARSGETVVLGQLARSALGLSPTDVLRILDVWGGGDGTLARPPLGEESAILGVPVHREQIQERPRRAPHVALPRLSRAQRRGVLAALELSLTALAGQGEGGQTQAWEAVQGYAEAFKRVFARLHVHERAGDHPHVAGLAALMSSGGRVDALADGLHPRAAMQARSVMTQTPGGPGRARTLLGGVEDALSRGELEDALALLESRPGLLGRALDRLLRVEAGTGSSAPLTLASFERAATRMAVSMLAGLHAHVARRAAPDPTRSFRSRGRGATRQLGDTRPPMSAATIARTQTIIERELYRRGAAATPLGTIEIDPDMLGVRLAASARQASGGLEGPAPGSVLPLTPAGTAPATTGRLFVHWAQRDGTGSIDLDLSVMAYDVEGRELARCTFSTLRAPGMVHSGDLRSAPLPVGATEYVDLDFDALRRAGAVMVIGSVYSYTSVPFSRMARASCGVMGRADTASGAREMDVATVRLKFDLTGEMTSCLLLAIDLTRPGEEQVIFLELAQNRSGYQVIEHDPALELARSVITQGQGMALPLLLGVHAARATQVRCGDLTLRRGEHENAADFGARVTAGLRALHAGETVAGDGPAQTPEGPQLVVADQIARSLSPGDTAMTLGAGTAQPEGVTTPGLRGLLAL